MRLNLNNISINLKIIYKKKGCKIMLKVKVIGVGAAGNKAAIKLMKEGEFSSKDTMLINSTRKDIPDEFADTAVILSAANNGLGGCGKERDMGRGLILRDMRTGNIAFDDFLDQETNIAIVVASTEGGTGSASAPVIAQYIKEVCHIPVIVCLFFGFNTDVRGMQNSIEICRELPDNVGVIGISNQKFLEQANNNRIKAEQLANQKFCDIVRIITGKDLVPSSQNIDDTDLFKLVTTEGYLIIEEINDISKVKNQKQLNEIIRETMDNSVLVDSDGGAKRIGVVYDAPQSVIDNLECDSSFICEKYGTPYEMYTHIQNSDKGGLYWITAGMNLPIKEIQDIYQNYMNTSKEVNKDKDAFFESIMSLNGIPEDKSFNMLSFKKDPARTVEEKDAFFGKFGFSTPRKANNSQQKNSEGVKDSKKEY